MEEAGAPGSGIYRAVLKIKDVRQQDYKNYTFKLGNQHERDIRLVKGQRDSAIIGSDNASSPLLHSSTILLLLATLVNTLVYLTR